VRSANLQRPIQHEKATIQKFNPRAVEKHRALHASTLPRSHASTAFGLSSPVKPGKAKKNIFEVQFFKAQSARFNIQGPFNLLTA
jgi:hypothetical protein